jgi:hypothetical protein
MRQRKRNILRRRIKYRGKKQREDVQVRAAYFLEFDSKEVPAIVLLLKSFAFSLFPYFETICSGKNQSPTFL